MDLEVTPPNQVTVQVTATAGPTGPQGPTGATGPAGPQGDPATNLVSSVFGRVGAVVATLADYTAALIAYASAFGTTVAAALDGIIAQLAALVLTVGVVPNAAALANVNGSDGAHYFVLTFRDTFVASNRATPPTVSAGTVVAHPAGGNWRWERLNIPHPSWALQATIYINAGASPVVSSIPSGTFSAGDDEADGTALTSPIKTHAELLRRLGDIYRPRINQTIIACGAMDALVWTVACTPNVGGTGILNYRGALQAQTTATITGVTAINPATNTDSQFACAVGWTAASEVNRLVIDSAGQYTHVIEQGATAADTVTGQWVASDPITSPRITNTGAGATAVSRTATSYVHLTTWANSQITLGGDYFAVTDVDFSGTNRFFSQGANMITNRCRYSGTTIRHSGGNLYVNAALLTAPGSMLGNDNYARSFLNACVVKGAPAATTSPSGTTFRNNTVFHGVGVSAAQSARLFLDGVCFRKIAGVADAVTLTGAATARVTVALWGAGNTSSGKALNVARGSHVLITSGLVPSLVFSGGDILLAGLAASWTEDETTGAPLAARNFTFALLSTARSTGGWSGSMTNSLLGASVGVQ